MKVGLHNLVTDWGGFEKFVADLHDTGDFEIERNVVLPARDGGTYEIDVLLTSRAGPYVYKTLVSCKYWKRKVTRTAINDLIQARNQVGAQKAICFTGSGYQNPSAVAAARAENIDLYVVKDLLPTDWGSPGRVITIVMQLFQVGLSLSFTPPMQAFGPAPPADWLTNVDPEQVQVTLPDGTPNGTLAERCAKITSMACEQIRSKNCTYSGGIDLVFDQVVEYSRCAFEGGPRTVRHGPYAVSVEKFRCSAVVRLHQRPIVIDRSKVFDFSVVVEDYLNNARQIVSRRPGGKTSWEPARSASTPNNDDTIAGDTILVTALLAIPLPPALVTQVLNQNAEPHGEPQPQHANGGDRSDR